jgi:pimeloyl-ACP methyl ester carboxylesterase
MRLILLHSGVTDARSWAEVIPRLEAAGHRAEAYTRAGGSPLEELRRRLEEPAWLVGNSMGGALALDAALTVPDKVLGLVLIAAAVTGQPEPGDDEEDVDATALWDQGKIVQLWLDGPRSPEGRVDGPVRDLVADQGPDFDDGVNAWDRLEEIQAPAWVAWGDLDVTEVIGTSRALVARLPNVRGTHLFRGAAHLPGLERPDEVADLILRALSAP